MTNDYELYLYCKEKLENKCDWESILKSLVKEGNVTRYSSIEDIRSTYRDLAGRIAAGEKIATDGSKYDEAYETLLSQIGKTAPKFKSAKPFKNKNDNIITISDLHVPFHNLEMLGKIADEWQGKASTCVIAGDLMNGDAISDHIKIVHNDFNNEVAQTILVLEWLKSIFPNVYLLSGNHDEDRMVRTVGKSHRADVASFIAKHANLLDIVTKDTGVIQAKNTHSNKHAHKLNHTLVLGDCLWSHLTVSGRDGKSVRKVENWYKNWKDFLSFNDVNVFQQGHTHQLGINYNYGNAIIQTGCMLNHEAIEYSLESHGHGTPPVVGYTVIEQIAGKTNLESIQIRKLNT